MLQTQTYGASFNYGKREHCTECANAIMTFVCSRASAPTLLNSILVNIHDKITYFHVFSLYFICMEGKQQQL